MEDYVFEEMLHPACYINTDGCITAVNSAFSIFVNISSKRFTRKQIPIQELFSENTEIIAQQIKDTLDSDTPTFSSELVEYINEELNAFNLKMVNCDGKILVLVNDISLEKKLLNKYQKQIEHIYSIQDQFIDTSLVAKRITHAISKEFNSPLLSSAKSLFDLKGFLNKQELEDEEDAVYFMKKIGTDLSKIAATIKNIRVLGGIRDHDEQIKSVSSVINMMIKSATTIANEYNVFIENNVHENITDENQISLCCPEIEQAIKNIVLNACQAFSKDAVARSIGFDWGIVREKEITYLEIIISDNASGIKNEHKKKVFDQFFTTKRMGKGMGVGLTISKLLIESHKGSIELNERITNGSQFIIKLPLQGNSAAISSNNEYNFGSIVLLTSDPNTAVQMKNFFDLSGVEINVSKFPEDFEAKAENLAQHDVIIFDSSQDYSVSDAADVIRFHSKRTDVYYILSLEENYMYLKDIEEKNITGVILKPFTKDSLMKSMRSSNINKD